MLITLSEISEIASPISPYPGIVRWVNLSFSLLFRGEMLGPDAQSAELDPFDRKDPHFLC
jgi:hypothetical protein